LHDAVRVYIDNTGQRYQNVQVFAGRFSLSTVSRVVVDKTETTAHTCGPSQPLKQPKIIDFAGHIRAM